MLVGSGRLLWCCMAMSTCCMSNWLSTGRLTRSGFTPSRLQMEMGVQTLSSIWQCKIKVTTKTTLTIKNHEGAITLCRHLKSNTSNWVINQMECSKEYCDPSKIPWPAQSSYHCTRWNWKFLAAWLHFASKRLQMSQEDQAIKKTREIINACKQSGSLPISLKPTRTQSLTCLAAPYSKTMS